MITITNILGGVLIGCACLDGQNRWRFVVALTGALLQAYAWYNIGASSVVCGG